MPTLVIIALWVATLHRTHLALRVGPTLWRWSYAAALWCVAGGFTVWAHPTLVRPFGVPNLDDLLTHLLTTAGGACVVVYLLTLTHRVVPRFYLLWVGGVALTSLVVQWCTWAWAPIHGREIDDLASLPSTPALLMHAMVHYIGLILVLVATAITCARLARRASRREPVIRAGLALISSGTAVAAVALVIFAVRMTDAALNPDQPSPALRAVGDTLAAPAVAFIALGTVLFVGGHSFQQLWTTFREVALLRPLHRRLRDLHPTVALNAHPLRAAEAVYLERIRIEIHDALTQQTIPPHGPASITAIAKAIHAGYDQGGPTAAERFPTADDRAHDARLLGALARAYNKEVRNARNAP